MAVITDPTVERFTIVVSEKYVRDPGGRGIGCTGVVGGRAGGTGKERRTGQTARTRHVSERRQRGADLIYSAEEPDRVTIGSARGHLRGAASARRFHRFWKP
jgi:hypothetical protein